MRVIFLFLVMISEASDRTIVTSRKEPFVVICQTEALNLSRMGLDLNEFIKFVFFIVFYHMNGSGTVRFSNTSEENFSFFTADKLWIHDTFFISHERLAVGSWLLDFTNTFITICTEDCRQAVFFTIDAYCVKYCFLVAILPDGIFFIIVSLSVSCTWVKSPESHIVIFRCGNESTVIF